jgi:hypothetical protein
MLRAAATAGILALVLAGCIVTDEIEFSDDVNYPPQVIGVSPDNSAVQTECRGESPEFQLSLWDPDEEDAPPVTEAEIRVWLDIGSADEGVVAGDCTVFATSPTADSPYEGGVLLTAACTMTILSEGSPTSVSDGLLLTSVLVSDRPFVHGVPPEAARTAEVFWPVEVLANDECPQ